MLPSSVISSPRSISSLQQADGGTGTSPTPLNRESKVVVAGVAETFCTRDLVRDGSPAGVCMAEGGDEEKGHGHGIERPIRVHSVL